MPGWLAGAVAAERAALAEAGPRIWSVGDLCHAVADALNARFNPVAVRGEVSGFARAASGHCYFSLKDATGQLRCAMFKRAAGLLEFVPRDGDLVEVRGRLGVYEPRGDLQLIVESMRQAGAGALFEEFLRRKARLQAEGLFDVQRKRVLPAVPRAIGVVTSLGAAAWHDVVTALRRRLPHVPVLLAPAMVQGAGAPEQLVQALERLYQRVADARASPPDGDPGTVFSPVPDVILLVRGGGSMEDLWAFNDEALARAIVRSPVPVVCGVGHETDFTIADFVADVRAPTPTAAAELATPDRQALLRGLQLYRERLARAMQSRIHQRSQQLDYLSRRLLSPMQQVQHQQQHLQQLQLRLTHAIARQLQRQQQRLSGLQQSLAHLNPNAVLQRGYALVEKLDGDLVQDSAQLAPGDQVKLTLGRGSAQADIRATSET